VNPTSPLRYPGGKQLLCNVLARIIQSNEIEGGAYAEPYAGGAGAALALLFAERVGRLILNDADPCVFAMWRSILDETVAFVKLVRETPLTIDEWRRQRGIYKAPHSHTQLEVGFSAFYLNRTNRSGIIKNGGPIGGFEQNGKWKIDARYNRTELPQRIQRIAAYRRRISFQNLDALVFMKEIRSSPRMFVYLDPPYFLKGRELYLNHYNRDDHRSVADFMKEGHPFKWAMSYDRAAEIEKLYRDFRQVKVCLSYSASTRREGHEVLILGKRLKFPPEWRRGLSSDVLKVQ
jgi:DNA adenine methylase